MFIDLTPGAMIQSPLLDSRAFNLCARVLNGGLQPKGNIMKKFVRVLLTIALAFVVLTGLRWYRYVSNTDSPYDEIGINLNNAMPSPINAWGCARLKTNFDGFLPPYGCYGVNATQWK